MQKPSIIILSFLILSSQLGSANTSWISCDSKKLPSPKEYPAEKATAETLKTNVQLHFNSKNARLFKSAISSAFTKPSNFADHFVIAHWGCGSSCSQFAIANKETGEIYFAPDINVVVDVYGQNQERLVYNIDSRLLVITGSINEDSNDKGQFFYKWEKNNLIPICKEALKPIDPNSFDEID